MRKYFFLEFQLSNKYLMSVFHYRIKWVGHSNTAMHLEEGLALPAHLLEEGPLVISYARNHHTSLPAESSSGPPPAACGTTVVGLSPPVACGTSAIRTLKCEGGTGFAYRIATPAHSYLIPSKKASIIINQYYYYGTKY